MQIDYCLILAAGFGTRMGNVGKKLPKVLWPIFEKTLLELQVAYAKSLGIQKIYINLHHMGESILKKCQEIPAFHDVEFLLEQPDILDIGGAIHNLASRLSRPYSGRLLVINADQFFYIDPTEFQNSMLQMEQRKSLLFTYWVNTKDGYNALKISPERVALGILKNSELQANSKVETYTGISVVDLNGLKPVKGPSKFFESVCNLNQPNNKAILLENTEYWDFGTLKRYWESCFRILSIYRTNSNHPFLRFLVREKALKTWKIGLGLNSYYSRTPGVINLGPDEYSKPLMPAILLDKIETINLKSPGIYFEDCFDEII